MESLDEIRRRMAGHRAVEVADEGRRRAAVAVVLRDRERGPEILFIERSTRADDPWSGHMAFPGGRVGPADSHPQAAAERETREEVGLDLAGAEALGRLDDMHGHHKAGVPALVISAFVYHLPQPRPLVTNHEVREAFWFGLASLRDPERHVPHPGLRRRGVHYPAIRLGDPERHVVWGLTYRFLENFFQVLGDPLPDRWRGTS